MQDFYETNAFFRIYLKRTICDKIFQDKLIEYGTLSGIIP